MWPLKLRHDQTIAPREVLPNFEVVGHEDLPKYTALNGLRGRRHTPSGKESVEAIANRRIYKEQCYEPVLLKEI